jgi:hypothetical protein
VTKSGDSIDVAGVDVYVPSKTFTIKLTLNAADFTPEREQNTYFVTIAPVNAAPFMGYAAGEVLFMGSSGGLKQNDPTGDITFKFAASPNLTGMTIGGVGGIAKYGWESVDIVRETADAESDGAKYLVPQVSGVYVHQVYNTSNFALLGLT